MAANLAQDIIPTVFDFEAPIIPRSSTSESGTTGLVGQGRLPVNATSLIKREPSSRNNQETIALPSGWTAIIRNADMYLPTEIASAALEALYDHILNDWHDRQQIVGPEGIVERVVYRYGELRAVLTSPHGMIPRTVVRALIEIMRQRARNGMPLAWDGILFRDGAGPADFWIVGVGAAAAWFGWPQIVGGP